MRFTKRCDECPALVLWAREEIRRRKNIAATKRYQDKKQSKAEREMLKKLLGEDAKDKPEKKPENPYPVEKPKQRCPRCNTKPELRDSCTLCDGSGYR